jgi:ATP phosphoribosyltransferase regulatory subunit
VIRLEPSTPPDVLAAIRRPFLGQDATLVETPVLQPLALLLDISGEAMRPRLFVVQADGIDEACLRPDLTIGVASAHIQSGARQGRYLYEGKAFRVAPPGSERSEEFLQIGLELYGGGDPAPADAAVAGLAWRSAVAGGRDDLVMEMGDIALFRPFLDALGLPRALAERLERAFRRPRSFRAELERAQAGGNGEDARHGRLAELLARLPEGEAAQALEELWSLAGVQPVGGRSPGEIVHRLAERAEAARAPALSPQDAGRIGAFLAISDSPGPALDKVRALADGPALDKVLQAWAVRLERLAEEGAPAERLRFSPSFGRAFGYYDGFVFEVRSPALGPEQPVAAGGRYDGLMLRLGSKMRLPAVGCMVRPWRAYAQGEARGQ